MVLTVDRIFYKHYNGEQLTLPASPPEQFEPDVIRFVRQVVMHWMMHSVGIPGAPNCFIYIFRIKYIENKLIQLNVRVRSHGGTLPMEWPRLRVMLRIVRQWRLKTLCVNR